MLPPRLLALVFTVAAVAASSRAQITVVRGVGCPGAYEPTVVAYDPTTGMRTSPVPGALLDVFCPPTLAGPAGLLSTCCDPTSSIVTLVGTCSSTPLLLLGPGLGCLGSIVPCSITCAPFAAVPGPALFRVGPLPAQLGFTACFQCLCATVDPLTANPCICVSLKVTVTVV